MTGTRWRPRGSGRLIVGLFILVLAAFGLLTGTATASPTPEPAPAPASPAATAPAATPSHSPTGPEAINVRVLGADRKPVEGVDISIDGDAGPVGQGTTDASGAVRIGVPGPGNYRITLDEKTLPKGTSLKNADRNPASTIVGGAQVKSFIFPLQSGDAPAAARNLGKLGQVPQLAMQGLRFGLILSLASIGLSIIFGTTGLTNFAHGELITLGAFATYSLNLAGVPFLLAVPIALVICGAAGWLNDAAVWAPLRRRGTGLIAMMIISIGLGLFVRYLLAYWYGGSNLFFREYSSQAGIALGPISVRPSDLFVIGISLAVLALVGVLLQRTRLGKATRAVADNPALASASGINVNQVIRIVWVVGAILAGLAGIFLALGQGVNYLAGFQILLLVFAAVVLGGLGTVWGAVVGSIIVGLFIELSALVLPSELKYVGALVIMILILLVRPQGILGRQQRVG